MNKPSSVTCNQALKVSLTLQLPTSEGKWPLGSEAVVAISGTSFSIFLKCFLDNMHRHMKCGEGWKWKVFWRPTTDLHLCVGWSWAVPELHISTLRHCKEVMKLHTWSMTFYFIIIVVSNIHDDTSLVSSIKSVKLLKSVQTWCHTVCVGHEAEAARQEGKLKIRFLVDWPFNCL